MRRCIWWTPRSAVDEHPLTTATLASLAAYELLVYANSTDAISVFLMHDRAPPPGLVRRCAGGGCRQRRRHDDGLRRRGLSDPAAARATRRRGGRPGR
ncbi:MAG: hypothetical protein IT379_19010 [Deltaproteobacteria bacterium]|nr:hypothetical protein [Deltaproteobacteria bacterium]